MVEKLKLWRESRGVSLAALGEIVGGSPSYLCRIENGDAVPSAAYAKKISEATGGIVSAQEVLGLDK